MMVKVPRGCGLVLMLILFLWYSGGAPANSQTAGIFLNPDTTFITSGDGIIFTVNIEVDENLDSLKSYELLLDFNKQVFDTCIFDTTNYHPDSLEVDTFYAVKVEQGPLMHSGGAETFFQWTLTSDSGAVDIRDVILGAGEYVDGPGVLAKLHFMTKGSGVSPLVFQHVLLKKSFYDTIPSVSTDGAAFVNAPPNRFQLMFPGDSAIIKKWEQSLLVLDWEDAATYYPGDSILYTLYLSPNSNFDPDSTDSILNLNMSEYEINLDTAFSEPSNLIFWKVKATNTYGFERWCDVDYLRFVVLTYMPPSDFSLLSPGDGEEKKAYEESSVILDWEDATTPYPQDSILYCLQYSTSESFPPDSIFSIDSLNESEYEFFIDTFTVASVTIYWRVKAFNTYSLETWCDPSHFHFTIKNYVLGDANGNGEVSIADIVYIINYLFSQGPQPNPLESANVNCDEDASIVDAVWLVNYLFRNGPAPGEC
jgi:hypothetical protein